MLISHGPQNNLCSFLESTFPIFKLSIVGVRLKMAHFRQIDRKPESIKGKTSYKRLAQGNSTSDVVAAKTRAEF